MNVIDELRRSLLKQVRANRRPVGVYLGASEMNGMIADVRSLQCVEIREDGVLFDGLPVRRVAEASHLFIGTEEY